MNSKQIIDEVHNMLYRLVYNEISFTTMLKVEDYFNNLKEKIRLEGIENDRVANRD